MIKTLFKLTLLLVITVRLTGFGACSQSAKVRLDPASPTAVECWHYYNGEQLANFNGLVDTFNATVGLTEGILLTSTSQGNVIELSDAVRTAAASSTGDLPDILATYPGTAFDLAAAGRLVDLNQYLKAADLDSFQPDFLAEGRFFAGSKAGLYVLPIAKSSEVVALNLTDWQAFTADNPRYGDPSTDLSTWETISQAAEAYYNWSGGTAMIGFDSLANFIIAGSRQLGVSLLDTSDGKMALNLDREALHQIWKVYYAGIVSGGFGAVGQYRADDLASGALIAGVVSTASGTWLPGHVSESGGSRPIDLLILPYPTFRDGQSVCIQQGAGMSVIRTDTQHETAAAIFLDWLIRPEQNVSFSVKSSYLPVTRQALQSQLLRDSIQDLGKESGTLSASARCLDALLEQMKTSTLYFPGTFRGSGQIRSYLESSLAEAARSARQKWLDDQLGNIAVEQLQSRYINDAAFESWYSDVMLGIDRILESSGD